MLPKGGLGVRPVWAKGVDLFHVLGRALVCFVKGQKK